MRMDLVSAYPAMLLGLAVGRGRSQGRAARADPGRGRDRLHGARSVRVDGPQPASPEGNGAFTPAIWALFAIVNAGSWALGIGMGTAVAGLRRARHPC